MRPQAECGLD